MRCFAWAGKTILGHRSLLIFSVSGNGAFVSKVGSFGVFQRMRNCGWLLFPGSIGSVLVTLAHISRTREMTNHEAGLFLIGIGIGILIVVLLWRR
jgi:hypothetical protein